MSLIASALVATLALVVLVRLNSWTSRKLGNRISAWEGTRIRALKFQAQEILSEGEIVRILRGLVRILRLLVLLVLIYAYLQFVFTLFPWTRGLAAGLLDSTQNAVVLVFLAIIGFLPNLILILFILAIAYYLIKLAGLSFNGIREGRIEVPGFYQEWARPTFNIVRFLIVVFALIVVFPYLPGSGSAAFQGVSIFLGLLISLGSTGAVANLVGGIVITYMRAFRVGDRVRIADAEGEVVENTLLVTRIRTLKNVDVAIPNALVLTNHIINFTSQAREGGLILHTTVTIGYDVPWLKVHETLIEAARETSGIAEDPSPFVLQTSLDDFYVSYEINAHTRHPDRMAAIYSDLHQNIQNRFHEAAIEITSPHFSAVRDANRTTIPDDYLPSNYRAPGFRIHPLEGLLNLGTDRKRS